VRRLLDFLSDNRPVRGDFLWLAVMAAVALALPAVALSYYWGMEEGSTTSLGDEVAFDIMRPNGTLLSGGAALKQIHLKDPGLVAVLGARQSLYRLPADTVVLAQDPQKQTVIYLRSPTGSVFERPALSAATVSTYYVAPYSYASTWVTLQQGTPLSWRWRLLAGVLLAILSTPLALWLAHRPGRDGGEEDDEDWRRDGEPDPDPRPISGPSGDLVPDYPPDFDLLPPGPVPERDLSLV